jgi:hypothetical protein
MSKNGCEKIGDIKRILGKRGIKKLKSFLDNFVEIARRKIGYNLESEGAIIIKSPTIEANLEIGDVSVNIYYSFSEGGGIARVKYKENIVYETPLLDLRDVYSILKNKKVNFNEG